MHCCRETIEVLRHTLQAEWQELTACSISSLVASGTLPISSFVALIQRIKKNFNKFKKRTGFSRSIQLLVLD